MSFKSIDIKNLIESEELTPLDETDNNYFRLENRDGIIYYFVKPKSQKYRHNFWMKNLLGEKIANFFEKETVHYKKANYENEIGVISKSFRKENVNYLTGCELIEEYINTISDEKLSEYYGRLPRKDILYYANDLVTIWNALEYRYKDRNDKEEIVRSLMDEFTDLFEFSLLTGDIDRTQLNYEIEEENSEVRLAPYFDFNYIYSDFNGSSLSVELEDNDKPFEVQLSKYLWYTDSERIERFRTKLENLTEETVETFLNEIIKENALPEERNELYKVKNNILTNFKINRNRLQTVINSYSSGKSI